MKFVINAVIAASDWRNRKMDELKPCLCGGKAKWRYSKPYGWVECKKCGAKAGVFLDCYEEADCKQAAIAAWNRRADHLPDTTKKVSNADRIRSMSDEELAEWLVDANMCERVCAEEDYCGCCVDRVTDWLKQPVKEE